MSKVTSISINTNKKVDFSKAKPRKEDTNKIKGVLAEGVERTKMVAHNSLYTAIYGGVMVFVAFFLIKIAGVIASFVVGYETTGLMNTVGDLVMTYVIIIMSCGFTLFFGIKLENVLLKALKKRLWFMKDGVIVKGDENK